MSTGIKNGKHHTFNIYKAILFFVFVAIPVLSASTLGDTTGRGWIID